MPSRASARPHSLSFLYFRLHSHFRLQLLHISASINTQSETHYDTLGLPHHATGVEIKKRYFELSKVHHPDRNRNDPHSPQRFIAISSAYAVLGNDKHRTIYDRNLHLHGNSSPVGGRPASGLSRRRTQPHGPPPSFIRNGGWSVFKGKPTHTRWGGPSGFGDVPHFSYEKKYREHEYLQSRWANKTRGRRDEPSAGIGFPLVGVTTILLVVTSVVIYSDL